MKPSLQTLKAVAVGAALAAATLQAADPPAIIPPIPADAGKPDVVADLKAQLQKMKQDANLEREYHRALADMVNGSKDNETGKSVPGLAAKVDALDKRLAAIEEKLAKFDPIAFQATLDKLDAKLTEMVKSATTVQKPDAADKKPADQKAPEPMPGPAAVAKASVKIVNEFPVPISLKVNEVAYRVEPNDERTVEVPPGDYTYELLNTGTPVVTRTLKPSQSETLRIK